MVMLSKRMMIKLEYRNNLSLIGKTPIITVENNLIPEDKVLKLKLEYYNPNFSIKDRTAIGLIEKAEEKGLLHPGMHIIESTSGNLGKSLAMIGAIKKYKVTLVVDPKIENSMLNIYKAYGANVVSVSTPDENGSYQKVRIKKVKEIISSDKENNYYWPNQYENTDNCEYHYKYTGNEFLNIETDCIISAVSTGGHICGIGKKIKENRDVKIIGVDVEGSKIFGGESKPYLINGAGLSWTSQNLNFNSLDYCVKVTDSLAISLCRYFAKNNGLMLGGSSGLSLAGAIYMLNHTDVKVATAIIPDTGINYLNQIYDDNWVLKNTKILEDKEKILNEIDNIKVWETQHEEFIQ